MPEILILGLARIVVGKLMTKVLQFLEALLVVALNEGASNPVGIRSFLQVWHLGGVNRSSQKIH